MGEPLGEEERPVWNLMEEEVVLPTLTGAGGEGGVGAEVTRVGGVGVYVCGGGGGGGSGEDGFEDGLDGSEEEGGGEGGGV